MAGRATQPGFLAHDSGRGGALVNTNDDPPTRPGQFRLARVNLVHIGVVDGLAAPPDARLVLGEAPDGPIAILVAVFLRMVLIKQGIETRDF